MEPHVIEDHSEAEPRPVAPSETPATQLLAKEISSATPLPIDALPIIPPPASDRRLPWKVLAIAAVAIVIAAGVVIRGVLNSHASNGDAPSAPPGTPIELAQNGSPSSPGSQAAEPAPTSFPAGEAIVVKTIHPKLNPHFERDDTQPAYVQGFFTADLMAHVAGAVKMIEKNIGDRISDGEILVELDVPDLVQDLVQKTASVKQAEGDATAAEAAVAVAEASAKVAESDVLEKQAAEAHSAALKKFHEEEYGRYKILAEKDAVVANILDEKLRDLEAATADLRTAQIATATARARAEEFSAKSAAARVDVQVKQARVGVAQGVRSQAQAMLDYAKIRAPFNGIIVARRVDPGSFVQNASTGNPTPMLRVVKTDVVTAVVWVPEKDTPYISKDTNVSLRLDALPGSDIKSKVTRFSHWLDPDKGRDMRVEVDIDNRAGKLTPGMYGNMTLVLQQFSNALLVPAGAVFATGGQTSIYEVRDGRAIRVSVVVQFEDGIQAKIVKRITRRDPISGKEEEVDQELAADDAIVLSGQGELANGQPVRTIASSW